MHWCSYMYMCMYPIHDYSLTLATKYLFGALHVHVHVHVCEGYTAYNSGSTMYNEKKFSVYHQERE